MVQCNEFPLQAISSTHQPQTSRERQLVQLLVTRNNTENNNYSYFICLVQLTRRTGCVVDRNGEFSFDNCKLILISTIWRHKLNKLINCINGNKKYM